MYLSKTIYVLSAAQCLMGVWSNGLYFVLGNFACVVWGGLNEKIVGCFDGVRAVCVFVRGLWWSVGS
jgi:hypothetical protein